MCYYVEKENVFFLFFFSKNAAMVYSLIPTYGTFCVQLLLSDFFKILKLATILNRQLKK